MQPEPSVMLRRILALFIGVACFWAFSVSADNGNRVPTMTRLVAEFMDKEMALIAALKAGNREILNQLVDPVFQLEPARRGGGDFVPYEQWIASSSRQSSGYADTPLNMAVREFGGIAAVTFEWEVSPHSKSKAPERYQVADLWTAREGNWRLVFRVVALLPQRNNGELPGQPKAEPVVPKKY